MRLTKAILAVACLFVAGGHQSLFGQAPAPQVGYLRFWDMLPPENGAFELRKIGAPESEGAMLSGTAYRYTSYIEFPPGAYHLGVYKKGDHTTPLKIVDINLRQKTFFTVLVAPSGGVINVEVIQDTNDPKIASGSVVVRNYFPGLIVSVSSDSQSYVDQLAYGQTHTITDLPLKRLPLTLRTKLPNGTPAESEAEADLQASKRGTLLIIPDSYGRFRPRVTIDGKE